MDWSKIGNGLDTFLKQTDKIADQYATVRLAKMGVARPQPTTMLQTTGANDPGVIVGQAANVQSNDPYVQQLLDMGKEAVNKTGQVAVANEFRKSLPYLVGGMALAITIFLLTKK